MDFKNATREELVEAKEVAKMKLGQFRSLPENLTHMYKSEVSKIIGFITAVNLQLRKIGSEDKEDSKDEVIAYLRKKVESQANHLRQVMESNKGSNIDSLTSKQIKQKRKLLNEREVNLSLIMREVISEKYSPKEGYDVYVEACARRKDRKMATQ